MLLGVVSPSTVAATVLPDRAACCRRTIAGVAVEDAGEHHAVADDLEREAGAACAHAAGNGTPAVVVLISLRRYARRAAADHRSDAYNLARPKPARHPGRVLGPQTRGRRS